MDFKEKRAKLEFDETAISAQKVARLIGDTPHMMGEDMRYAGALLLSVPDLRDNEAARTAKDALGKVKGVEKAATDTKQKTLTVEFGPKGEVTSKELLEALAQVGMKASTKEPKKGAQKTANDAGTAGSEDPNHAGMAMENGEMEGNGEMAHRMHCGCPWCAPLRGPHAVRRMGGCCR